MRSSIITALCAFLWVTSGLGAEDRDFAKSVFRFEVRDENDPAKNRGAVLAAKWKELRRHANADHEFDTWMRSTYPRIDFTRTQLEHIRRLLDLTRGDSNGANSSRTTAPAPIMGMTKGRQAHRGHFLKTHLIKLPPAKFFERFPELARGTWSQLPTTARLYWLNPDVGFAELEKLLPLDDRWKSQARFEGAKSAWETEHRASVVASLPSATKRSIRTIWDRTHDLSKVEEKHPLPAIVLKDVIAGKKKRQRSSGSGQKEPPAATHRVRYEPPSLGFFPNNQTGKGIVLSDSKTFFTRTPPLFRRMSREGVRFGVGSVVAKGLGPVVGSGISSAAAGRFVSVDAEEDFWREVWGGVERGVKMGGMGVVVGTPAGEFFARLGRFSRLRREVGTSVTLLGMEVWESWRREEPVSWGVLAFANPWAVRAMDRGLSRGMGVVGRGLTFGLGWSRRGASLARRMRGGSVASWGATAALFLGFEGLSEGKAWLDRGLYERRMGEWVSERDEYAKEWEEGAEVSRRGVLLRTLWRLSGKWEEGVGERMAREAQVMEGARDRGDRWAMRAMAEGERADRRQLESLRSWMWGEVQGMVSVKTWEERCEGAEESSLRASFDRRFRQWRSTATESLFALTQIRPAYELLVSSMMDCLETG